MYSIAKIFRLNETYYMQTKAAIIQERIINYLISPDLNNGEAIKIINRLQVLYSQPGRHYHNFEHILQVINFLCDNLKYIDNPRVIFWTTLFHDIVYDTHSDFEYNENESAKFAKNELTGKLPDEEIKKVCLFINATAMHDNRLRNSDLLLFLDADIAILGAESKIYKKYSNNIRKEYSWVAEQQYADARIKVLQNFLARKRIYSTDIIYNLFEKQARINMLNEIDYLNKIKI